MSALKEKNPGVAYKSLRKLAAQPGDCSDDGNFKLLSHEDQGFTTQQSLENIASHFAKISQDFPAISYDLLNDSVKSKLSHADNDPNIPEVSDYEVFEKIKKSKKPASTVPGDLPCKLLKEFGLEMSTPASYIYRNIIKTGIWPKQWRTEYGTPIQKKPNPETEDDLRIISLTSFLSKTFERFVIDWLLFYIGDKLDWSQYGGLKGSSITHYLVDLVNFMKYNQDLKVPHAVIALLIDYKSAFNRVNHNIVVNILSELGTPGWLLRIVVGFLSERELIVKYKGLQSERMMLPGSCPQGTLLGLFLFLVLINAAGSGYLQKHIGNFITKSLNKRKPMQDITLKYIDDMTQAFAVNVREVSSVDPNPVRPLSYHERTGHIQNVNTLLPAQQELEKAVEYCKINEMMINFPKTNVMFFNSSRKVDFLPRLQVGADKYLEVVPRQKLLGVIIQDDLRWNSNTQNLCRNGFRKLWMIRRLKNLGAKEEELLDVYVKQIRSGLELAVPVWEPGLTKRERKQLERVQKTAFSIILGINYRSYDEALVLLNMDSLSSRRKSICLKFAKKALKDPKYTNWFIPNVKNGPDTRSEKNVLLPVSTRTKRFEHSPLPFLTNLLNQEFKI